MKSLPKVVFAAVCALTATSGAVAQDAAPAPAPTAAPAPAAGNFADDEIQKFAVAAVELNKLQADTAIPEAEKQPQMAAIVQKNGLDPARFNAIAQASQTDTALMKKVQDAAAAAQTAPAAPAAAAPAPAQPAPAQ